MTGFSADWLDLREPFDRVARGSAGPALAAQVAAARGRTRASNAEPPTFSVIDLACGTGANLRALAPRIGGVQHWRLIDHDPALLAAMPAAMARWTQHNGYRIDAGGGGDGTLRIDGPDFSVQLVSGCVDLARDPGAVGGAQADLFTASALLDLVSAPWLAALIDGARGSAAAWLFALNVDGRTSWDPPIDGDATVHRLFGEHQRRDKGFGPALGPSAVPYAVRSLSDAGYTVRQARSDWVVDGRDEDGPTRRMLEAMIDGMAGAAIEQNAAASDAVRVWQARRFAALACSRLTVGHVDIMAVPGQMPDPDPTTGQGPSGIR